MYVLTPANLIVAPLGLWLAACLAWAFGPAGAARSLHSVAGVLAFAGHFALAPRSA